MNTITTTDTFCRRCGLNQAALVHHATANGHTFDQVGGEL